MIFQYVWLGMLILIYVSWTVYAIYDIYKEYKECDSILEALKESYIAVTWILINLLVLFILSLVAYFQNHAG